MRPAGTVYTPKSAPHEAEHKCGSFLTTYDSARPRLQRGLGWRESLELRPAASSLEPSWSNQETVRLRRATMQIKVSQLNILLRFRTLSVLMGTKPGKAGIPSGENPQAAGKAFTLPCCGPIGCQQGHLFWEEPMSDRPWLRVRPIRAES